MKRMGRWHWISLIALTILVASFAGSFLFSASYQICAPDDYTHAKNCAQHHLGPFIIFWIVAEADAHSGLVTAIATVFMAGFTATLWFVTDRSVRLAREEFIATHRPRIIVRQVSYDPIGPDDTVIEAYLYNKGESKAFISECTFEAMIFDGNESVVWKPDSIHFAATELDCGRDTVLVGKIERLLTAFDTDFGKNTLIIQGRIRYRDALGLYRLTGFCQQEVPDEGHFVVCDLAIGGGNFED